MDDFDEIIEDNELNPVNHIYEQMAEMEKQGHSIEDLRAMLLELFTELGHEEKLVQKMTMKFLAHYKIKCMNKK